MNLPERFEQVLQNQKLILPGDKVFVACSGGPDSVALFYLLQNLEKKWNLKLCILHFNHKLRGAESDRDEKFVETLARKFHVRVIKGKPNRLLKPKSPKESLEEAARRMRYGFFAQAAKRHPILKVAVAHTQDDQAETILMRILQGTGLRGLGGIRSRLEMKGMTIVRPLLEFRKKEILDFLKAREFSFRNDRSNLSEKFVRNRIRHKLLPWLEKEFNPRVVPALARLPVIIKDENQLSDELEDAAWKQVFNRRLGKRVYLNRKKFLNFLPALQFRMLDRALKRLDQQSGMSFDAWQKLKQYLREARYRQSFPKDIDFVLTPSRLVVYKKFAGGYAGG